MSDSNKPLNKLDEKRLKESRGQGSGHSYVPFIKVGEFSSSGETVRVKSSTVGRIHHLFSGIELAAFLIFDRNPASIDIREQFPIPLTDSIAICDQLGIRHPSDKGELSIVTTDLVIDRKDDVGLAIAVKPAQKLDNKRTLEKLQIEKAYWETREVKWFIFTDKEVPHALNTNLKWMRRFLDEDTKKDYAISDDDVSNLIIRLSKSNDKKVTKRCAELDDEYQLEPGTHIEVLRYAIANNLIGADLTQEHFDWDIQGLSLNNSEQVKGKFGNVS